MYANDIMKSEQIRARSPFMSAEKLKVNHISNPVGISRDQIILSWIPVGSIAQSAYRIKISSRGEIVIDTGKIESPATMYLPTCRFDSRTRYDFSVILWDENGIESEESKGFFETGIEKNEICAKWIDPEFPNREEIVRNDRIYHKASYLTKKFSLERTENARLYITAHGIYDAYINGKHVDGYLLSPGTSQYNKRLQVQTYDISELVKSGENEIVVTLGDGWWRGTCGYNADQNVFGDDIALLCQLEIDGKVALVSDGTWMASQSGPLGFNDTMRGEEYDARRVISDWHAVEVKAYPLDNLICTSMPITAHERFRAKFITTPSGEKVLDFGQNFAGYVEFDLTAHNGNRIELLHGETLDRHGNFTQANYQNTDIPYCDQRIEYICTEGRNIYHQTKCYFGFRYVKVMTDIPITGDEFTGVAVYSDMEQTGFFRCGNADVNRLFENTVWSMKSNYVDVPTDCPTRERSGFSGDCQVFAGTAVYLMDCYAVLARWLREQCATQDERGCVKEIAPCTPIFDAMDGCAGWCDSMEIVPRYLTEFYNDNVLIGELYPYIKRWMQFCIDRAKEYREENKDMPIEFRDYFVDNGVHWGEWCEPGRGPLDYVTELRATGLPEEATAYLSYGCSIVSEMAENLGYKDDAAYFADIAEKAKAAYRYAFITDGKINSDRQCKYVRPLSFGLLEPCEKKQALCDLVSLIKKNGNRIGTGFLTTYDICNVLTDNGFSDVAYDMLLCTDCPSWLNEVKKGATTIWESWNGINADGDAAGSLNHYSFGAISGWLITKVGGITLKNGEIRIKPYTDRRLGFADVTLESPLGRIVSRWEYAGEKLRLNFEIPCNAHAAIVLPNGEAHRVIAGIHEYEI